MNIPPAQIHYRKKIGHRGGRSVYGIGTIGGLHLIACAREGGGLDILGAGSHSMIARTVAKRHSSEIIFDDIAKSEQLDPRDYQDLLDSWVEVTNQLRAAIK